MLSPINNTTCFTAKQRAVFAWGRLYRWPGFRQVNCRRRQIEWNSFAR